jgi:hypothetical protein
VECKLFVLVARVLLSNKDKNYLFAANASLFQTGSKTFHTFCGLIPAAAT